jgi:hypothetical protein
MEATPAPVEPIKPPAESASLVQPTPFAETEPAVETAPAAETRPAAAAPAPRIEEASPAAVSAAETVHEEPQTPALVSAPAVIVQAGRANPASIIASLKSGASDLVQIETDPHKVQTIVEEQEAPRAPRVRRPRPVIPDEPLVQIETRARQAAEEALPHA